MISQRHLARIAAMQAIFSVLHRSGLSVSDALEYSISQLPETLENTNFAQELAEGALSKKEEIVQLVQDHTHDKNFEKIDILTLSILYVSVFELSFAQDKQPPAVVINEAVELAKEFGKESSPSLINALLSKMKNA